LQELAKTFLLYIRASYAKAEYNYHLNL